MPATRYNQMWMMVMFDLPVTTAKERKKATAFRKGLLDLGFEMSQFSVYVRFCGDRQKTVPYVNEIKKLMPEGGSVTLVFFTDKQFSDIINFSNRKRKKIKENPAQLSLF